MRMRMIRFWFVFALLTAMAAALTACGQPREVVRSVGAIAGEGYPLVPRTALFGNPDRASATLSADGSKLAFLAPLDGVLNVWVGPKDSPNLAQPVTADKNRGIRRYFWAYDNQHIVYLQDQGGDENWRIYSVDVATRAVRDLTPLPGVQATIEEVSPKFPTEMLIGLNDRDARYHDIYRLNLLTGQRQLVQPNPEFDGFITDDDFRIRFAMKTTPDGGSELLRAAEGKWISFMKVAPDDVMTTSPVGFDKENNRLYMKDSRGRNTAALAVLDLATGEEKIIAEDAQADISGAMVHPTEKTIQAVASTYERKKWRILDPAIEGDLQYLRTVADGDIEVVDRTLDDSQWIVVFLLDDGPARTYRYDRAAKKAQFLFVNRQSLLRTTLSKMHPVVIPARDGLPLVSYLTLPPGSDKRATGRPDSPLPMVLLVHGGPWGRSNWGFDALHQWLANRGYAVLDVNFRASTGFGKAFVNASNREWGGKMHDDLIDGVRWAIEQKVANPNKIAIAGGSYGGYATLVGLTFTPDVFACGVDIVGPSNLVTLINSVPPYWKPQLDVFYTRMGDPRTEAGEQFLLSRSPLTFADRIKRPLLIGQGANDPRVKQAESDQIVQAMKAKNIPVTYVLYPDEGHGFARPPNRLSFFAVMEQFLSRVLGGRAQPIGEDFKGSSITAPEGVEYLPGLKAALSGPR